MNGMGVWYNFLSGCRMAHVSIGMLSLTGPPPPPASPSHPHSSCFVQLQALFFNIYYCRCWCRCCCFLSLSLPLLFPVLSPSAALTPFRWPPSSFLFCCWCLAFVCLLPVCCCISYKYWRARCPSLYYGPHRFPNNHK